jgi:chromate transporter
MNDDATSNSTVSLKTAFGYWLKLGFISFGGPTGQIAIMHQDLVEKKHWISEKRFLHALNYCMLLPGPEAQQLAIYIGWLMHGIRGGIIAGTLFVLPSLFILVALSWIYLQFGNLPSVAGVLYGIKPAITAIVLFAAYRIGSRALQHWSLWLIALCAFIAIFVFKIPFPMVILTAALLGSLGGKFYPQIFNTSGGHKAKQKDYGAAMIDDNIRLEHTYFKWSRCMLIILSGLLLWVGLLATLIFHYGWDGVATQMGWFFTKAALLTFGGAYAVLPYVHQGAVEHYHWLSTAQMMDGLALGETTPGPLIMIVAFVGFVGGWQQPFLTTSDLFINGFVASSIVTYFTFLPSFLFILIGAPLVESTYGNLKVTSPLTGITAAVVGVIINLAVFFAYHSFLPQGLTGQIDLVAVLVALITLIALIRYKIGIIPIIISCGLFGFALHFTKIIF